MKGKETAIEVKVGALVLLAIVVFGLFVVIIGGVHLPGQSSTLYVDYDGAAGLKPGAPVKVAGIAVGKIKGVEYKGGAYDEAVGRPVYVRVTTTIDSAKLKDIHTNAKFGISTEGILGDPYIEITSRDTSTPIVKEGDVVRGKDPLAMADALDSVSDILDGVKEVVDRINEKEGTTKPIHLDEFINNIGSLAGSLDDRIRENADNIDSIFDDVALILDDNKEKVSSIMDNVDDLTNEFAKVGKSVNHGLGRGQSLKSILDNLDTTMDSVAENVDPILVDAKSAMHNVDGILEENRAGIKTTIDNLAVATDDVKDVTGRIREGEGSLGALMKDEEIFEDVREMVRELKRRPWRIIWKE